MYHKFIHAFEQRFKVDARYFISNSFWVTCNQIVSIGGSLVLTIAFAHFLTEEMFGNYRYLVVLASLFAIVSLNSISQSILQTAAKGYLGYYQTALRLGLWSNTGTAISAFLVGGYYLYNNNSLLGFGCIAIAFLQPFISNYFSIFSFLTGKGMFLSSTIFQTIRIAIITIGSLGAILLTTDILVLFIVYLTLQLGTNMAGYYYFKPKPSELTVETPAEEEKKYNRFALHLSIQNGVLAAANRLDALIVFQFLGATALAVYSIALIVPDQLKSMVKNFSTLLFPKYVNYTPQQLIRSIPGRSLQLFIALLLLTTLYVVLAPIIIGTLLPKYESAIIYTQLLALAIPSSVFYIVQSAIKSQTNNSQLYYIQFSHSCIKIILVFAGIYSFGIWGAVGAYVVSSYVELALYYGVYFIQALRKQPTA